MNTEKITRILIEKASQWEKDQENQTSGYEYEKSYVEMMKEVEAEIFQEFVEPADRGAKKNFIPRRGK